jgi:hypothetical protein
MQRIAKISSAGWISEICDILDSEQRENELQKDNVIEIGPEWDSFSDKDLLHNYYYDVVSGSFVPRILIPVTVDKTSISADGIEKAVISGVPNETAITINNELHIADGTDIEFQSDTLGEFVFSFYLKPYLRTEVIINAN